MLAYLDHNATTPLDEKVFEAMLPYFRQHFGNASSRHEYGRNARKAVEEAREQVANAVGAHPSQVIFTSGGTEANNFMLKGASAYLKPSQLVVGSVEHPSVMKPAQELACMGWSLRKIASDGHGLLDLSDAELALQTPTGLVSTMLVNNETGVIQNVSAIAELARKQGAWMHTDAVQALGKINVNFASLNVHAMTLSAHKIYGPKGAAALVVDKRLELKPLISGGGHEKGLRAGTENVSAIVGFGVACELAQKRLAGSSGILFAMREKLENGLAGLGAVIFGQATNRVQNTSYFAFPGIDGETLVMELDRTGYAVASGSACSSGSTEPSSVLMAMQVERDLARGALRVSLGKDTADAQIDGFVVALETVLARLRKLSAIAV
ncbi:cysteine desulfurase family protein [Sulfurirhabdus autotrophica]|uniref:cysteine desulfurase n=1 Tax=Sulfurirhabdus autotrophica TaxID=1706046 RepID=A0A4R3YFJ7_9PROT|nr:cysteine desulfurase family protein [Sulfurirhabdus autotrophica]TCV90751.1 cysteine desulfurase [Sulfurirhabdus autotrophica]